MHRIIFVRFYAPQCIIYINALLSFSHYYCKLCIGLDLHFF